ncbi:hypothetical protein QBC47DRAFT_321849 [Echria macrotheca]|uniref:DUF6594 domain-containing protein n=1 Tax=Echria macrotheca TaxID=438768 RepID=A0AAJ0BEI4_9PEZI|nr:hypothetical protein QBC47DRAFT_321849 [Echria macrotheca]
MDIETPDPDTGFPALAKAIALNPDYECFIFHRFDRLAARNLLHLEAKLRYLEHKLNEADKLALSPLADTESRRSLRTWEALERNAADPSRPEHDRMELIEQIRENLDKYQTALLQQNQVATLLEPPRARALAVAQYLSYSYPDIRNNPSQKTHLLAGLSEARLSQPQPHTNDLLTIRRPVEKDPLSRFLQDHWFFGATSVSAKTEYIKERHVSWAAAGASIVVAAILLLGAIIVLHVLENKQAQLGVISLLTVLFALSVGVLTSARRSEIFASTAAYAAVLVVFVSSDQSSGPVSCTCTLG